ncbi:MAG: T9SS C-terminal target domain-containing protein [Saprospirales bacterium]|nr:MAG: T9SS C-terminal target domain-containing protein [Saprospirales bacterium]
MLAISIVGVYGQISFDGHDYFFQNGNCSSLLFEDSTEYLVLTEGLCNDNVLVEFNATTDFLLQTTGIEWSDSSKVILRFGSSFDEVEIVFERALGEDLLKVYLVNDQFAELQTSHGASLVSNLFDTLYIHMNGNFPLESISILNFMVMARGANFYLGLTFAGLPVISVNQDSFELNWISIGLGHTISSVEFLEIDYSNFIDIWGIEKFDTDVKEFQISWMPSEIEAGGSDIITGGNLNQVDGIFLNNKEVEYSFIDFENLKVDWPALLPESGDLVIVGTINAIVVENLPIEEPFITPYFDDFTSILFEDSSFTLYLKWNEPDPFFFGDYRLLIHEQYHGEVAPPELYQNTIVTSNNELILTGLPLGDGFRILLQKYDQSEDDFIDSDFRILEHSLNNDLSFMLPEKPYKLLLEWARNSIGIDMVSFFQQTSINPIAVRALLQKINNGRGFDSSTNPWYSDEGFIIFVPDDPDPDDPEPDDPPVDRGCECRTVTQSRGLHSDIHNASDYNYANEVWLLPDVSKHVSKDKKNKRRWMRTQKLGAAVYREVFTQRRRKSTRYNYFLNYDHENAENMPISAKPSQSSSSLTVSLVCNAIVNGRSTKTPCYNICKTSAHLKYRYNSQHILDLKSYANTLNSYARTFGADEVFLTVRHTNNSVSQQELIWAGIGAVEDFCSSSFNTDFLGVFGSFAGQLAQYIDFESGGFSFDLEELFDDPDNIKELLESLKEVLDTEFIKRQGNCDETARSTELNTQDEIYHFELGHGDEFVFTLYSKQRIGSRVLRARARTKIATDFHLLLNIGDLGYTSEKYESNRDSCCIFSRSLYIVGSHDTLYVGKNGIPFPDNPTFLADQNIVVTKYPDHISDIGGSIPVDLKNLIGGYLPLDKNHLHLPLESYIYCIPNSASGGSSLIISNKEFIRYQCRELNECIKFYPNPLGFNDLNIRISEEEIATKVSNIHIYNSNGQLIRSFFGNGLIKGEFTIFNIPNHFFPSGGMYFIELEVQDKYNIVKSVFVQR